MQGEPEGGQPRKLLPKVFLPRTACHSSEKLWTMSHTVRRERDAQCFALFFPFRPRPLAFVDFLVHLFPPASSCPLSLSLSLSLLLLLARTLTHKAGGCSWHALLACAAGLFILFCLSIIECIQTHTDIDTDAHTAAQEPDALLACSCSLAYSSSLLFILSTYLLSIVIGSQ